MATENLRPLRCPRPSLSPANDTHASLAQPENQISLHHQLVTQVVLGILCRQLAPGSRLPSTRELARRFAIHANTARAAYSELERQGWVEMRHGSGVFVCRNRPDAPATPEAAVDRLIGELAAKARKVGATETLLKSRLRRWLVLSPPARWLLIEPDPELRRIVVHELEKALALPVAGCAPEDCHQPHVLDAAMALVLPTKAARVRKLIPAERELTLLEVQPVSNKLQSKLARYLPEHAQDLVGIASRWTEFQRVAQTMLIAAGLRPESLLLRDATRPGWKRGLAATSAVVCDVVTAAELPKRCFPIEFCVISEASICQLRTIEAQLAGDEE